MSTFKKIGRVLLVLVLMAIYANIGYWIGQAWQFSQGLENPNIVNSFFLGPNRIIERTTIEASPLITSIVFTIFWPIILAVSGLTWLVYFMFCGGLFGTIGLKLSILAVIIGALIARICYVNRGGKKQIKEPTKT